MKLSQVLPKSISFNLRLLGDNLTLRPVTLEDEIWIADTFGESGIEEIFETVNFVEISRLVYRLLDDDSKPKLKKQDVTYYNEEGEETIVSVGGVQLLYRLISGLDEKEAIIGALLKNLGFTDKMLDELGDSSSKKKAQ